MIENYINQQHMNDEEAFQIPKDRTIVLLQIHLQNKVQYINMKMEKY
jgi:hypothetical protein